ncbi:MAG: alanine racemase [Planctomycetota bacterium]|jgi:alanine racemase
MNEITWVEIDLNAIAHNLKAIKRKAGQGTKVLAIVKADAYGHGAVRTSQTLVKNGVDMLGVAFPEEGVELRKNNINTPILVLNPILSEQIDDVIKYSLGVTVCCLDIANELSKTAIKCRRNVSVHVEVDTGMGGEGLCPNKALPFIKELLLIDNLEIEGIFTHFNSSEEKNKSFSKEQLKILKDFIKQIENEKIDIPLIHAANSAAILDIPGSYFNMVRPGILLYGIFPSKNGRTFEILKQTTVATLPVGYKDGFGRCFSNLAEVLINGKRAPIIGRVCMDRCFVDVTNHPNAKVGSEVTIYGNQANDTISIESAAKLIGSIPYEIVCNIGTKVQKKVYL